MYEIKSSCFPTCQTPQSEFNQNYNKMKTEYQEERAILTD